MRADRSEAAWLGLFDAAGAAAVTIDPRFIAYHTVPGDWRVDVGGLAEDLLWLVTRGVAVGRVGGRPATLEPGAMLWVPPGTAFAFALRRADRPVTLYRVRVRVPGGGSRRDPCRRVRWLGSHGRMWSLEPLMRCLVADASRAGPRAEAARRAMLKSVFAVLFERLADPADAAGGLSMTQQARLLDHISQHPDARLTPAALADHMGLAPDYFARVLRQTFGVPPRRWLVEQRIRYAAQLFQDTEMTVTHLAEMLGYCDVFLFSRQFKQVMGVSPTAYRHGVS